MITIKKIKTLKERVQLRKIADVFFLFGKGENVDALYLNELYDLLLSNPLITDNSFLDYSFSNVLIGKREFATDIYYHVLKVLGEEVADWDFLDEEGVLDSDKRLVLKHSLLLDRIRSPFNIGSIFRSSEAFGVDKIYIREGSADITSNRAQRSARGTIEVVEHEIIRDFSNLNGPFFALETGGTDIDDFEFPDNGICIIGSEETGVSPDLLSLCDSSLGRVSIPMYGAKGSLNVGVATGILLQKWGRN